MNISYRKPSLEELNEIYNIYETAIKNMESNNIFQWDSVYPNKAVLTDDILKGEMHIGFLDDEIAVAYVLNHESDKQYCNGNWKYPRASYRIVHRLCVNPEFQKMGIGTLVMQHISKEVKETGIESIRLDCFTNNPQAIQMYKKLDYNIVGYANWRKGKFYLMELKL